MTHVNVAADQIPKSALEPSKLKSVFWVCFYIWITLPQHSIDMLCLISKHFKMLRTVKE